METHTGFNFDLLQRNALLRERNIKSPTQRSTGTTLAATLFEDGVVLGADTRATAGEVVADKNIKKLHMMAPNVYCAGAGVSGDCDHVTEMVASAAKLHRYDTGRQTRVITITTLLKNHLQRYQGHIGAALIVGGVDLNGPQLSTIFQNGSTDSLPFATMGSGSLNAMTVLESGYKDGMTRQEAMDLVTRAIRSGVYNDLGSGSNVDLLIVTKDGGEMIRGHQILNAKTYTRRLPFSYANGPAMVTKEQLISLKDVIVEDDVMDTT